LSEAQTYKWDAIVPERSADLNLELNKSAGRKLILLMNVEHGVKEGHYRRG